MHIEIRSFEPSQTSQVLEVWATGWREAHSEIVPPELAKHRTFESFRERLNAHATRTRVAIAGQDVVGLCITRDDELDQLYVAGKARGTEAARRLLVDAEAQIQRSGYQIAWLACAIGNRRAERFYEKMGWQNTGKRVVGLDTSEGEFPLEVWRFEKRLALAKVR